MSRLARWVPLLGVVALLGAAMLAANFANPTISSAPLRPLIDQSSADPYSPPPDATISPTASAAASRNGPPLPGWVTWVFGSLCALAVLAVLAVLLTMVLRERLAQRAVPLSIADDGLPSPEETERRVRAAVDAGLSELDDADADPRRAVIACWVRLEAAAAAAGTARAAGDTSTELVSRLLATQQVSAWVLAAFAEVYREARFASHPVDAATRDHARASLRQLRDELAGGGVLRGR